MKNIFLLLLISSLQSLISQEITDLSENDTLYYFFKNKKSEFRGPLRPYNSTGTMTMMFHVDINNKRHFFQYLTHKRIGDGDRTIPILLKSRSFLKENRNRVHCYKSFKKMEPKELEDFYWENHNKVIYLIDKKENKDGKISLRRVRWNTAYLMKQ